MASSAVVLARVSKIEPGATKRFDEVKGQIKAEIAQAQAKGETQKLHDKIEDLRASGKTLAQAAQELGLQTQTYVTDASGAGKGEAGSPARRFPRSPPRPNWSRRFSPRTSASTMKPSPRKDGGFSWFEINAIETSRANCRWTRSGPLLVKAIQEGEAQKALGRQGQ